MVTEASMALRRLHKHYKNGVLPFAGGLMDQPAYFIDAMDLLETYDHKK